MSSKRQIIVEIVSLARLLWLANRRSPVVVVWARSYQKVIFGLLARIRPKSIIYVVHNPESSRWPRGARRVIEGWLLGGAVSVVHSESLRISLKNLGPYDARVVVHPPYMAWVSRIGARHVRRDTANQALRLLILGRLEPDKFRSLPDLVEALDRLPVPSILRVLVRPSATCIPATSNLLVENLSRDGWIDDFELAKGLEWADVLVAPYEAVTESGTVQLALTLGVRVVAFSGGALGQSLVHEAIAPAGEFDGLTDAILKVTQTIESTSRWTPESRARDCLNSWRAILPIEGPQTDSQRLVRAT